ncbi:hypothetical protein Amsp01_057780 [Amycolatopsis sp. NBRC 101858]|uniref:DUF6892 domain-containing protein n=1 Tax=Amycolatopsis sp. NBRC 101858 TaxID=3032200 RepID=UPI0024A2FF9F|nr:hypothetical protein [Amycolatopsis sp. NBRC 101858]GLY39755.1 hypothetical protein Amsp01_057780 [Amycolatopsis sp. NBRC 101858]
MFRDFNFKLVVVEKLMYQDEVLTPAFRFADVVPGGDAWQYAYDRGLAYQVQPEARAYFEALEISPELLATVDELLLDGGLQVYQECAPVWDGEDDLFDITSLADLALVPGLRRVVNSEFLGPELRAELTSRGIEAA